VDCHKRPAKSRVRHAFQIFKVQFYNGILLSFPTLGGRYIMADIAYADGNPCILDDGMTPYLFVLQQTRVSNNRGALLMKINQAGAIATSTGTAYVPPGPGCSNPDPNYGSYEANGPINIDTSMAPGNRGRVWVGLGVCSTVGSPPPPPATVRVLDAWNRDLCARIGCGLGGTACYASPSINTPFCEGPPQSQVCPAPCPTPWCPGSLS